jgi:hypothetical protein
MGYCDGAQGVAHRYPLPPERAILGYSTTNLCYLGHNLMVLWARGRTFLASRLASEIVTVVTDFQKPQPSSS